ncbi:MAG TPA: alpha-hydroxy acid oxidase [Streptosporangiaceae bacterium]|nr:alpha-hydroxy acid oxidase [Streptosporangiaceae bacterium]
MLSVADAEQLAAAVLPRDIWDFVSGGSETERTLAANRAALDSVYVVPKMLADVSRVTAATSLVGCEAAMPAAVAPMAYQRMVHPDGELGLASACAGAGIPYTAAMLASTSIEQIAEVGGCLWLQLYWLTDRGLMIDLVKRAEAVGVQALVLTVDVPRLGRRLKDMRNGFAFPDGIVAANLARESLPGSVPGSSAVDRHTAAIFDPSLSWSDLSWLTDRTNLPVMLKGILDANDAKRAVQAGAAAVVVSNHGGRQLDGAVPSITALPWVVEAVAGQCQVLLDSGIRGGTDMLRAMALGADGAMLGRPALWALAAGGQAGAARLLELLGEELAQAMALAGCRDLAGVRSLLTVVR